MMSALPEELKKALGESIDQLTFDTSGINFGQLGTKAKQEVYTAIINTLLGHDHQTVAKVLLDALQDDTVTPSDWNAILKAWAGEYADSNPVIKALLDALDDDNLSQAECIDVILTWIKSKINNPEIIKFIDDISSIADSPDLKTALEKFLIGLGWADTLAQEISQAITTGKITTQQIYQILATWAAALDEEDLARVLEQISAQNPEAKPYDIILAAIGKRLPSQVKAIFEQLVAGDWNGLLSAILGALDPGFEEKVLSEIATGKYINIILDWMKDKIRNPDIIEVIDKISAAADSPDLKTALEKFLVSLGWADTIAQEISQAITTGKITAKRVYQILAAWAAASGEEDLARVLEQISEQNPDVKPYDIILVAIGERLPSEVKIILEHLLAKDWNGLLATILGALDLGLGEQILTDIASGEYKKAAIEKLTELLTTAGVQPTYAGPLVSAVIDLVSGTRSLFVSGPEADAPYLKTPAMVAFWREIRSVIYMAQLACRNGALVPANPQAQPYVFLAAQIRFNTPLHQLVPPNANQQQRDEFRGTLTAFLDIHFGARMRRRFKDDNTTVMANLDLLPTSNSACMIVYINVDDRLKS